MDLDAQLFIACQHGNADEVERLLASGASANALSGGFSALTIAAARGDTAVVRLLLAAGTSPTLRGPDGLLPIHAAALNRHSEVVQLLLEAAPHTAAAAMDSGLMPMAIAVVKRDIETARLLLAACPEAAHWAPDRSPWPLNVAVCEGPVEMVRLLLAAAAPGGATEVGGPAWHDAQPRRGCTCRLGLAGVTRHVLPLAAVQAQKHVECLGIALTKAVKSQHGGGGILTPAEYVAIAGLLLHALLLDGQQPAPLSSLCCGGELALPLYADVVLARALTAEQWQLVPAPCPGLGCTLPSVLERSEAEAALLVAHMPAAKQQRLRTAALCLHRAQKRTRVALPSSIVGRLMALSAA